MFVLCVSAIVLFCFAIVSPSVSGNDIATDRRPVSLEQTDDWLVVANGRAGSIAVVDKRNWSLAMERVLGDKIVDLARMENDFVAVDQERHELIHFGIGDEIELLGRTRLPNSPVNVVYEPTLELISVASLWARQLTILDRGGEGRRVKVRDVIDLPFAPRLQCFAPDRRHLIVADAFGGKLAVVDLAESRIRAIRTLQAHNIRGLAVSHDESELLISHQMMNQDVPTERARVFWGTVMSNILRAVSFRNLTDFGDEQVQEVGDKSKRQVFRDAIHHWSLIPLGTSGDASGDPGEIHVSKNGQCVVVLSGVDEIAVRRRPLSPFKRLEVQRLPTATVIDTRRDVAIVANSLASSLSIVDLADNKITATLSLGAVAKSTSASRGESLFFDARLSLDGWFSCHSCHTDGHSSGMLNDNFGDDSAGAPKLVQTLLGASKTPPWAWLGTQNDLHDQIAKSIEKTMRGEIDKMPVDDYVADIAEYMTTLKPPPPLDIARGRSDEAAVARGKHVFNSNGCKTCHAPPHYTSKRSHDVGIADENGSKEFNPPSLLSVSQRSRFFHDGRATSLEAIFSEFKHPRNTKLTAQQREDLLAFLRQL